MAWDDITGEKDCFRGDRPADIIGAAFDNIIQTSLDEARQPPTKLEILNTVTSVLQNNLSEICCDCINTSVRRLSIKIENRTDLVFSSGTNPKQDPLFSTFYSAFKEIALVYQKRWERKPRIKELLETIIFSFYTYQKNVETIDIEDIEAEFERDETDLWWEIKDDGVIGTQSSAIIKTALEEAAKNYENTREKLPTLIEFADAIVSALNRNLEILRDDTEEMEVSKLTLYTTLGSKPIVSNPIARNADNFLVEVLDCTFSEIEQIYQQRWSRKPSIKELLKTIEYLLIDETNKYLSTKEYDSRSSGWDLEIEQLQVELSEKNSRYEIKLDSESNERQAKENTKSPGNKSENTPPWDYIGHSRSTEGKKYKDVVNDDATRLLESNFNEIAKSYKKINGNLPTLQMFLDYIASVILNHKKELLFLDDGLNSFQKLVMIIEDQPDLISDGGDLPADDPFVKAYTEAFTSLSKSYQLKWQRKPRIREVLATFDMAIDIILNDIVRDTNLDIYIEKTIVK